MYARIKDAFEEAEQARLARDAAQSDVKLLEGKVEEMEARLAAQVRCRKYRLFESHMVCHYMNGG